MVDQALAGCDLERARAADDQQAVNAGLLTASMIDRIPFPPSSLPGFIHVSLQPAEPAGPVYVLVHACKRSLRDHVFGLTPISETS